MKAIKIPKVVLKVVREPSKNYEPIYIKGPEDFERILGFMKDLPEEHFYAIFFNATMEVVGLQQVSHGSLAESLVHPREAFKAAIVVNAYAIAFAHNHPAGSRTASPQDIQTTETLISAGELLGIPVVDHVIISHRGITSIREQYPSMWKKQS